MVTPIVVIQMKIGKYSIPKFRLHPTLLNEVKKTYDKFEGGDVSPSLIADLLGQKITSGGFLQKLADMKAYGLISGRGKLKVSDLGKKIAYPVNEEEKMMALEVAIRSIELWDLLFNKFGASLPEHNFWVDLKQITGAESPEAQTKANLIRKAYLDDVGLLKMGELSKNPVSSDVTYLGGLESTPAQTSGGSIGYIGFPEYSKSPIEIKDEVSYNIAKQILDAIGKKLKEKESEKSNK